MKILIIRCLFLTFVISSCIVAMEGGFPNLYGIPRQVTQQISAHIEFNEDCYRYKYNLTSISLEEVQSSLEKDKPSRIEISLLPDCQSAVDNLDQFLVEYNQEKFGILRYLKLTTSNDTHRISKTPINVDIMNSFAPLTQLKELTFEGLVVDFSESPLVNLTMLNKLTLNKISFFGENFENIKLTNYEIKFKKFAEDLINLSNLEVLDLSDNDFFPHPTKGKAQYVKVDNDRCAMHVTQCAHLLASNFKGTSLIMTDNNLGPIFIKAYAESLEGTNITEIDFSKNSFKVNEAVNFIIEIKEKVQGDIKVILFPNGHFKEPNFNQLLLEELLDNVKIQ